MSGSVDTRRARRQRVSRLEPEVEHELFALRDAFVSDPDAGVRAAALLCLDARAAARLLPYVRDTCRDASLQVREAAFVALARARDVQALPRAAHSLAHERSFRVRRMALLFAARACGRDALPLVAVASQDPFWRVRVAARRVASAFEAAIDTARAELALPRGDLRELSDEDPAVVTARLLRVRAQIEPGRLLGALGDSHRALRRIAVKELAARGGVAELREALGWLSDERVPYGPAAAEAALRLSGAKAGEVAVQVLNEVFEAPAGVLAWAIRQLPHGPAWSRIEAWLVHPDIRVRCAAAARVVEGAPERAVLFDTLKGLLASGDEDTRIGAATWLHRTQSSDAKRLLAGLELSAQPTRVRELGVQALAALGDLTGLRTLSLDVHGGVRASALSALHHLGGLTQPERRELARDPDPWVREAVLDGQQALVATRDPSVRVRRAAVGLLGSAAECAEWAETATLQHETDPWLRARAAAVLAEATTPGATRGLLTLARDVDLGVRSAAQSALGAHRERVRHMLEAGALETAERIAAYTLLYVGRSVPSLPETDPAVLAHVTLLNDVAEGRAPAFAPAPEAPVVTGPTRALGRTGIVLNPFGLSGAHGLSFDDFGLAEAHGTSLFFWEPSHLELARFLRSRRRSQSVVVAGTYHADAAAIERDVVRALRALRREALDVFLAFWTRSTARLDEVTGVLQGLARRGLVRAVGISSHDRALAVDAAARGLDVVMVRHSAAHRGAESSVFPECVRRGTGVLTFSNLCYGRMLHRTPAVLSCPITAPDCYRYSLSQPGVGACIAAPRRHAELLENLEVAKVPWLSPERQAELRLHGDHVYARSKAWSAETWPETAAPASGVGAATESLADWAERPASIAADSW